jgi:starch synthase (maltosyl-transferring)
MVTRSHATHENDRWTASFTPPRPGRYVYGVEAWTDLFGTWRRDLLAKREAGMDVSLEIEEGRILLASLKLREETQARMIHEVCQTPAQGEDPTPSLSSQALAAATTAIKADLTRSPKYPLQADRSIARAGAWYEMMPRSQGSVPGRHGTFDDCIARLPDVAAMGFDVLYLPPIHPSAAQPEGSQQFARRHSRRSRQPYAISSIEADTTPCIELGTLDDFGACYGPAPSRNEVASISPSMLAGSSGLRSIGMVQAQADGSISTRKIPEEI